MNKRNKILSSCDKCTFIDNYLQRSMYRSTDQDYPGCSPGRRSICACGERIVLAFRIARPRDLTFERRFRGSSPLRSQFLLFVSGRRWHLTCVTPRLTAFPFYATPFFSPPRHRHHYLSLSFSFSLFLPSYPSYLRGQSYGESDRATVSVE